jgi:K+-sensing histidine kinase KdpD
MDAIRRYLLALGIVALTTLVRQALDPVLGNQAPYFLYVGVVVVITWLSGRGAAVAATIVSAFVGNFLFVPVRHQFVPHADDWAAMSLYTGVCLCLVWVNPLLPAREPKSPFPILGSVGRTPAEPG